MNIFFYRQLLMVAFLTVGFNLSAQQALKIGDAIPKEFWNEPFEMVNAAQKKQSLAADSNKLILLDFWGTWCSACLINFPKMEEIQKQYAGRIKVVAVTDQQRKIVEKFFASKNGKQYDRVLSIVEDKTLHSLFPHRGVPFVVWIKDGKVFNTTDAEQVTLKTVKEVLDGEKSSLQTVVQMGRERPFMLAESFDRQQKVNMLNYSILIKGAIPDIGSGGTYRKNPQGTIYGRQFTNQPLFSICFAIGYHIFMNSFKERFSEKRMMIEVKEPLSLKATSAAEGKMIANELYHYEMIVPERDADSLYLYMLKDLNRYTDFTAKIEKMDMKCLALVRTSSKDKIATKGGKRVSSFFGNPSVLQNVPLGHMVNMLNGKNPITDLAVIDETGYTGMVDIALPSITNLPELKKELKKYDLDLVEEVRGLNMLVIRDK